ncbi:MAG: hypothetical protein DRI95_06985, partial [Bacteroidetes bacterium]
FTKSLKVSIEHRGSIFTDSGIQLSSFAERPDWISSVAIWYQSNPTTIKETLPPAEDRIAPYELIASKDLDIRANPKIGLKKSKDGFTFTPMTPDASIEFDFTIEKAGRYQISAAITYTLFSGLYQAYLDDKPIGKVMDLYISGNDVLWKNFDLHNLSPGKHTLRFEGKGASPNTRSMAPPAYYFGMDYLILLRLEDMEGYHEALKKLSKK